MVIFLFGVLLWLANFSQAYIDPPGWRLREGPIQSQASAQSPTSVTRRPIICEGHFPKGISAMVLPGMYSSMLNMCALEQFGGRAIANAGAFCNIESNPPSVAFQFHPAWALLSTEYFRMICKIKCRCEPYVQHHPARGPILLNRYGNELTLIDFDRNGPVLSQKVRKTRGFSKPTFYLDREAGRLESVQTIRKEFLFTKTENYILCNSNLIRRIIIEDFYQYWPAISHIPKLADLCPATIVGGNPLGNLGGVCLRNRELGSILPEVYFPDEFVYPQYDWNAGPLARILRVACFAACHCDFSNFPDVYMLSRTCPWLRDLKTSQQWIEDNRENPALDIGSELSDEETLSTSPEDVTEDCSWDSQTCDIKTLGLTQGCKGSCTSVRDWCGSSSCHCVAIRRLAQQFASACLLLAGSNLGKRHSMSCPCNSSYVSDSCCSSGDGLVWESPALKLGILES